VILAILGGVGWFLFAAKDPCAELRDRCRELQAAAAAAAQKAAAAKAAADAAKKKCEEAKKAREKAEQRLKAASGEGGSWIEGTAHPGERLTSQDLALQAQYEASVRAHVASGQITEAQGQEMLSHWDDPALWNRLRKQEHDAAEAALNAAKAAETAACAEADRLAAEADAAAAASAAAAKAAAEACAAADECEKARRDQAVAQVPPVTQPVTPPVTPPATPGTVSAPPVTPPPVTPPVTPPPPKTKEKPDCEDGDTKTEVRCETEVDMFRLGEMTLDIDGAFLMGQEDVDKAMAGLTDTMWVIDLGTLAANALGNAPLAAGTWIAGKAGFPSFDTITSLPTDAALDGLRKLIEKMRDLRQIGTWTLKCNRYHVKARCEVKYTCQGGHWVVTSRTMTVEQVGGPTTISAPSMHVFPPKETSAAMRKMAAYFRNANQAPQRKLDECAKQCTA
jgi:hypothetical protein